MKLLISSFFLRTSILLFGFVFAFNAHAQQDWFVRIIAKDDNQNLVDRGTVLGEISTSLDSIDSHDLLELEPFGAPYLTVVFKKNQADGELVEYNSDFRSLSVSNVRVPKEWQFAVKSDDSNRDVTLTWEGDAPLDQMMMIDTVTGAEIFPVIAGKVRDYTFNMGGEVERNFIWIY